MNIPFNFTAQRLLILGLLILITILLLVKWYKR